MSRVLLVFLVPGLVLFVVAVGLRIRNRVLQGSGRVAHGEARRVIRGASVARDAVLSGVDRAGRRAVAAALVDLDARGVIAIRAPRSGTVPEIELVEGAGLSGLDAAIVSAYTGDSVVGVPGRRAPVAPHGSRRERRVRLWNVIRVIDGDLERAGAARMPARWPAVLIAVGAVAGMVVTVLGMVLFSDEPARVEVCAAGFAACLVALVVVPMRVRLPLAASAGRRRELAVARSVVRAGEVSGEAPLAYVTAFARDSALARIGVGPDAVPLSELARAADPGSGRWRLATSSFGVIDSLATLLP